jgi:hypothetical protein
MMTAPTQPLSSEDMKFERAGPMPRDTARWRNGLGAIALALCAQIPEMLALARGLAEEESARASIDRGWILGFIATLFAIHAGRMGFDRTFLGIMSPGFATLGDLAIALLMAFVVVIPFSVLWRRLTRAPER